MFTNYADLLKTKISTMSKKLPEAALLTVEQPAMIFADYPAYFNVQNYEHQNVLSSVRWIKGISEKRCQGLSVIGKGVQRIFVYKEIKPKWRLLELLQSL